MRKRGSELTLLGGLVMMTQRQRYRRHNRVWCWRQYYAAPTFMPREVVLLAHNVALVCMYIHM